MFDKVAVAAQGDVRKRIRENAGALKIMMRAVGLEDIGHFEVVLTGAVVLVRKEEVLKPCVFGAGDGFVEPVGLFGRHGCFLCANLCCLPKS